MEILNDAKYVSDIIGDEYYNWEPGSINIISTQTGSGKTTFILEKLLKHAASLNKYLVYFCNRRTLDNQIGAKMSNSSNGFLDISHTDKDYFQIVTYQYCEATNQYPNFSFTPKPSEFSKQDYFFRKMYNLLDSKKIDSKDVLYYVFDEAHYFVSDALLNPKTNYWHPSKFRLDHAVSVFLTATPEPLYCYLEFRNLKINELFECAFDQYKAIAAQNKELSQPTNYNEFVMMKQLYELGDFIPQNKFLDFLTDNQRREIQSINAHPFHLALKVIEYINLNHNDLSFLKHKDRCYSKKANYEYIIEQYFEEYHELYNDIISSDSKWIVFVDSEIEGRAIEDYLKYNNILSVFITAKRRSNKRSGAKDTFAQIATSNSFDCKVLISTSVIDCGVSIDAVEDMNIVISQPDKTEFLQMIGRCRIKNNAKLNLYIKNITAGRINGLRAKLDSNLRNMMNFYFRNADYDSQNSRSDIIEKLLTKTYSGLIYANPIIKSINPNTILPNYNISFTALVYCLYTLNYLLEALYKKDDDSFYLKRQLEWIDKEYSEKKWFNFEKNVESLKDFLKEFSAKGELDATQQKIFCTTCLEHIRHFQKCLLPESMKNFLKRNNSYCNNSIVPKKRLLNTFFEYRNINYKIFSKQSYKNDRKTVWYVKKLSEQE